MTENFHDFQLKTIAGQNKSFNEFKGKVVLAVNVASKCGLTPQYTGLESLYETYRGKGFEVLGFPANEFGAQEPGTNQEIEQFCTTNYGVKFPMFEKIVVKGLGIHPIYKFLTKTKPEAQKQPESNFETKLRNFGVPAGEKGEILWNFEKFLIGKQGQVLARFAPDVAPNDPMIVKAIEEALK